MRGTQLTLTGEALPPPAWTPNPEGEHGEVFTRRWVVDLILDLVGYRPEADLGGSTIVEPACGCGAFLLPIVERLSESSAMHGRVLADLDDAVRGFDLLAHNADHTRKAVTAKLLELGESLSTAEHLAQSWVTTGDFLLTDHGDDVADFVVGNPPYVRLEQIPDEVSDAYRSECSTMRGRADLFVGFFEKGLALLAPGGRLGFICADRWMRNQYGARLRQLVGDRYALEALIEMHDADAFEASVSSYPAITVLRNAPQGRVKLVEARPSFDEAASPPSCTLASLRSRRGAGRRFFRGRGAEGMAHRRRSLADRFAVRPRTIGRPRIPIPSARRSADRYASRNRHRDRLR